MQNPRTLQLWDSFYQSKVQEEGESHEEEWIIRPTDALMHQLLLPCFAQFSSGPTAAHLDILEIGCGTSSFSKSILAFWKKQEQENTALFQRTGPIELRILATDVSKTCIYHNKRRDCSLILDTISSSLPSLQYATLNAVEPTAEELQMLEQWGSFDLVFDKGGLDTFLFRSRYRGSDRADHPVVHSILQNIFSWLRPVTGIYTTITPRVKIKPLRNFGGFSQIDRRNLSAEASTAPLGDPNAVAAAKLELKSVQLKPVEFFAYICYRNESFNPAEGIELDAQQELAPLDSDACQKCKTKFSEFRGSLCLGSKSAKAWRREWKGHQSHCKGC
uniref:Methyltransferase domain-containing protein n=1 Tax=Entomoneis paludosa TaxID=265537 RepID=A0A7S2YDU0_9STRA|mmetsp:Transcript_28767/g.60148  ORF Transcript_28767/g.60148 Transcript_28767/m.60148 type:complete len:332 (+) Transcript_28767:146-1141(+)